MKPRPSRRERGFTKLTTMKRTSIICLLAFLAILCAMFASCQSAPVTRTTTTAKSLTGGSTTTVTERPYNPDADFDALTTETGRALFNLTRSN